MYQLNSDSSFVQSVAEMDQCEGSHGRRTVQRCGMGQCRAGSFVREGGNENQAQRLGRQSGLPDAPSTAPKLTHPDHASPGSQKVCVISDSKFKAHDINLSSDLYVKRILQTKGNRKGEFANTCQYIRTHAQKAWCLFICVNMPCVCAPMCTWADRMGLSGILYCSLPHAFGTGPS